MTFRAPLIFVLLSILSGCTGPQAVMLNKTDSFPPTANVEILPDHFTRPFKTFAILEDVYVGTPEEINERLSRKAREI